MISEVKQYIDQDGRTVTGHAPMTFGCDIYIKTTYMGTVGIPSSMGVIPFEFPFPDEYKLEECFAIFDKHAKEHVEAKMEEERNKNIIVMPDQI